eukprot:15444002-Alexandrium_andersonii.AAC.1
MQPEHWRRRAKRDSSGARLWEAGLRISADSEPRRGPFGPSGELGPRAQGLEFEAWASFEQRAKWRN